LKPTRRGGVEVRTRLDSLGWGSRSHSVEEGGCRSIPAPLRFQQTSSICCTPTGTRTLHTRINKTRDTFTGDEIAARRDALSKIEEAANRANINIDMDALDKDFGKLTGGTPLSKLPHDVINDRYYIG
jgi:hypothetical protein